MILSYIIIYVKFVYDYVTEDKVIRSHGLDIDNYLLSPRVNLQQLIRYCYNKNISENELLFSEKHLCNDCDFGDSFSRVCNKEIARLNKVIGNGMYSDNHDEIVAQDALTIRKKTNYQTKWDILEEEPIKLLFYNDAVDQLDDGIH